MNRILFFLFLLICSLHTQAVAQSRDSNERQKAKEYVYYGNKAYETKEFEKANELYNNAILTDSTYSKAYFNLANVLYSQQKNEEARSNYKKAARFDTQKKNTASIQYNIGNTFLNEKKYKKAIDAYKKALRIAPKNAHAKYNLAYAQLMLKKDQKNKDKNKEKNKDKDKKENKEQNKDKKENKDEGEQENKDKEKGDKEKSKQSQPKDLSKQQADAILNALRKDEQKLQEKGKEVKGSVSPPQKDW